MTQDQSDAVLLQRIEEQRAQIDALQRRLKPTVRISVAVRKVLRLADPRNWHELVQILMAAIGAPIALTVVVCGLVIEAASPTAHFYAEYSDDGPAIYQTVDWGRDRRVRSCEDQTLAVCLSAARREWTDYLRAVTVPMETP